MAGNVTKVRDVSVDSYCASRPEGDVASLFNFTGANYSGNHSLNLYPGANPSPNS